MRLALLLAAVLLLAALILFGQHDEGFGLSSVSPDRANVIRIMGMTEILLARKGAGWEIEKPVRGRANPHAVEKILSILEAKSERKLKAGDLSRFGLDNPSLRLFIDGEEFDFGMLNPLDRKQYVKKGDAVYLISPGYALLPSLSDLEAEHA